MASTGVERNSKLSLKQVLFCQYYVSHEIAGNACAAYALAYGLNLSDSRQNATARANASRLLTNANIMKKIRSEMAKLKPSISDFEAGLYVTMTQFHDLRLKFAALKLGYKWFKAIRVRV